MIYIALPVMDEMERLPDLLRAVGQQTYADYRLVICVNQPDSWWNDPEKRAVCNANKEALNLINSLNDNKIVVFDKSSPGKGWTPETYGIGYARKILMDYISQIAAPGDVLLSMDADTVFNPTYFETIQDNIRQHPDVYAISVPYYHNLTTDDNVNRAILKYEIYMRAYAVNLWNIGSKYCFTALGSAIAMPVWAYLSVGGMAPKLSGEDFYLVQKLVKHGKILHWNQEIVYPAARQSSRVFFGTGPAVTKGMQGIWESYPIYHPDLFRLISQTYNAFNQLFSEDIETPVDDFFRQKSGELPWQKLRKNFKNKDKFVRACHEKFDGLRILQFLKEKQPAGETTDVEALKETFRLNQLKGESFCYLIPRDFTFSEADIPTLQDIRNQLFRIEMEFRRKHWEEATLGNK